MSCKASELESQKTSTTSLYVINPSDTMLQIRIKSTDSNDERLGCRAFRNIPREPAEKRKMLGEDEERHHKMRPPKAT